MQGRQLKKVKRSNTYLCHESHAKHISQQDLLEIGPSEVRETSEATWVGHYLRYFSTSSSS